MEVNRQAMVTWCIHHALSRPARRTVRFYRTRPTTAAPNYADQAVEGSSFVEDFVPHQENALGESKRIFPRRRYFFENSFADTKYSNKDCPDCKLEGVVTLGESRSYSVMHHPRVNNLRDAPSQSESTVIVTNPFETTTELTTEAITTTENAPVDAGVGILELEPASLLTEERPYVTAVQRSHFSVDEAVHSPLTAPGKRDVVPYQPVEKAIIASSTAATYPSSTGATDPLASSQISHKSILTTETIVPTNADSSSASVSAETSSQYSSPVSYRTSLKTATSGSSVSFYRQLPAVPQSTTVSPLSVAPRTEGLKTETRVEAVSYREEVVVPQRSTERTEPGAVINQEKSYQFTNVHDKSFHHVQVTHLEPSDKKRSFAPASSTQGYSQPEKIYGLPEKNYEVDEALSVQSNGRAHGVQGAESADSNKFGYVVEGRNFKKYRVEERTSDGFIVGEYGVVRHDDGSLRGVRYTADSTINPKVIYEALVKFLSL